MVRSCSSLVGLDDDRNKMIEADPLGGDVFNMVRSCSSLVGLDDIGNSTIILRHNSLF
jgi:hypothetical protein